MSNLYYLKNVKPRVQFAWCFSHFLMFKTFDILALIQLEPYGFSVRLDFLINTLVTPSTFRKELRLQW